MLVCLYLNDMKFLLWRVFLIIKNVVLVWMEGKIG